MIGCDFDPAFVFRGALRQTDYTKGRQVLAEKRLPTAYGSAEWGTIGSATVRELSDEYAPKKYLVGS